MRPPSILLFERLYIVKIVLGLVAGAFALSRISATILPTGAPVAVQKMMPVIMIASMAFGVIVSLLLLYFIARRASDVAKWIFVVFFALGAIALSAVFQGVFPSPAGCMASRWYRLRWGR